MRDNPAFSMVHESDEETEAMLQQPDSGPIFSIKLPASPIVSKDKLRQEILLC